MATSNDRQAAHRLRRNRRDPYVNQACNECKRRKVKCDGVNPCAKCVRNSISCEYHPHPRVSAADPQSPDSTRSIRPSQQPTQQETPLDMTNSAPPQNPSPVTFQYSSPRSDTRSSQRPSEGGHNSPEFCGPSSSEFTFEVVKGNLKAMGIPATILDKSTQGTSRFSNVPCQLAQYGPYMKLQAQDPMWDMNRGDAINNIEQWFSETGSLYAVVSKEQMLEVAHNVFDVMQSVNVHDTKSRGALAECLSHNKTKKLKLILAIGRTLESGGRNDLAQRLLQSATEAIEGLLWSTNSINNIQLLVLMALYYYHLDEEVRTGRIIGFAARLCLEMGLHRRATINSLANSKEQAAALQTFWCVYMLERRTSLGQGIPFYIQDCHIDPALFTMGGRDAVTAALLDWTKLAGRTWHALNSQGEKESAINFDELDYLDYQIGQWYQHLSDDMKLESIQPGQEIRHVQAVIFLRKSHLYNLIYRPVLQSPTRIAQHQRHAHKAAAIAKESLQMLSGLNENTGIIKRNPLFFKHLLLTAFGNLLLAVVNASSMFCDNVKVEFDIALDMIRMLSNRSPLLMALWKRLQGLRRLRAQLSSYTATTASSSNGQGEEAQSLDCSPDTDAMLFDELFPALQADAMDMPVNTLGDTMVRDQLNGFFDLPPVSASGTGSSWVFATWDGSA
ncbi:Zn(2)-C6 fungal-type domain-containing protein [Fusarium sp. LHS14.1]|nr:Zn(2)-C6 fungal-type domain-containing protein [Fusarium sp. LHS14.1]